MMTLSIDYENRYCVHDKSWICWLILQSIKTKRMRWMGHVAQMEGRRGAYWILVERREGERPLGSGGLIWEDNIKIDLQEMGWVGIK
jgi:hypothetical protein